MKRPAFQFYPADWRNNAKLRRCSWAARGVWIELLGLMHDSDDYGVLRWSLKEIAQALGAPIALVRELVEKGVLYGAESGHCEPMIYTPVSGRKQGEPVELIAPQAGPIWYSPRMVRDEYVRGRSGGSTRFQPNSDPNKPQSTRARASGTTDRQRLRDAVYAKTEGRCAHCDSALQDDWQIDHWLPRSKGGAGTLDNLVPSCLRCNRDKADTLPADWRSPFRAPESAPNAAPCRRQGEDESDGSTSSSSSSSSPSVANATSGEDRRRRFEMHADWQPDEVNLRFPLRTAGLVLEAITPALLAEFTGYWITQPNEYTHADWCRRLVQHAVRNRATLAAGATHESTATRGGAAAGSISLADNLNDFGWADGLEIL